MRVVEEKSSKQLYIDKVKETCENTPKEKLDPSLTALGKERIARTLHLLQTISNLKDQRIIDIGCGTGLLAHALADRGAIVTAVDASNRLASHFPSILFKQAIIPYLPFDDTGFEGVIFTDVIADIEPSLYRLTFSELSRLLIREGWLVCSTPLDIHSIDATERFIELIKSEFDIIDIIPSFHRLHFHVMRFLQAPERFLRAAHDPHYRQKQLNKRSRLARRWFTLNSQKWLAPLWRPFSFLFSATKQTIQNHRFCLIFLERLSEMLWGKSALTHLIILARKKKITYNS